MNYHSMLMQVSCPGFETGDTMPEQSTPAVSFSQADVKTAMGNMSRAFVLWLSVAAISGLLVGGLGGYAIAKT